MKIRMKQPRIHNIYTQAPGQKPLKQMRQAVLTQPVNQTGQNEDGGWNEDDVVLGKTTLQVKL